jgi:four helix bundle protein
MEDFDQLFVSEARREYIATHRQLRVYVRGFDLAMRIYSLVDSFPPKEARRLEDQIVRSSRSVCLNIAEAWRKRRYKAAFIAKLSDVEGEAGETQASLEFAAACGYLDRELMEELWHEYEELIGSIVGMIKYADKWANLPKH